MNNSQTVLIGICGRLEYPLCLLQAVLVIVCFLYGIFVQWLKFTNSLFKDKRNSEEYTLCFRLFVFLFVYVLLFLFFSLFLWSSLNLKWTIISSGWISKKIYSSLFRDLKGIHFRTQRAHGISSAISWNGLGRGWIVSRLASDCSTNYKLSALAGNPACFLG